MYPILSALIIVVGIALFAVSSRVSSKGMSICLKIVGVVLAVVGAVLLCLLLSGTITLPLSAN